MLSGDDFPQTPLALWEMDALKKEIAETEAYLAKLNATLNEKTKLQLVANITVEELQAFLASKS